VKDISAEQARSFGFQPGVLMRQAQMRGTWKGLKKLRIYLYRISTTKTFTSLRNLLLLVFIFRSLKMKFITTILSPGALLALALIPLTTLCLTSNYGPPTVDLSNSTYRGIYNQYYY
jgi:hypothetical protein